MYQNPLTLTMTDNLWPSGTYNNMFLSLANIVHQIKCSFVVVESFPVKVEEIFTWSVGFSKMSSSGRAGWQRGWNWALLNALKVEMLELLSRKCADCHLLWIFLFEWWERGRIIIIMILMFNVTGVSWGEHHRKCIGKGASVRSRPRGNSGKKDLDIEMI